MPPTMAAEKKRPGGPVPTNAELRERGKARLEVWVEDEHIRKLEALAEASGMSRPNYIKKLIDAAYRRLTKR
jgi:hypothetical protein